MVWVVEPRFQTVTVYQRGAEPELFNARQELVGDPYLPGFRLPVAEIFSK
jgi:Uma2 family endonuclease